jgi:hypothetical protein
MRDPWGRRVDVFDVLGLVLGVAFFALAVVCVIAFVTALSTLGDPPETYKFGVGFLKGIRVLGVIFFPLAAIVTFFTGWAMAGGLLRRWWRDVRTHEEDATHGDEGAGGPRGGPSP